MNLSRRINTLFSIISWARQRRADADRFIKLFDNDLGHVEDIIGPLAGKRVLEIGCGMNYPHMVMFQSLGCDVTGIDLEVVPPAEGFSGYLKYSRKHGRKKALRAFIYHYLLDRKIHSDIRRRLGRLGRKGPLDIRVMDAGKMQFADNTFDLIYSCATLEHVQDLSAVLSEIKRVLKPDGLAVLGFHLFASRTGGHAFDRDERTGKRVEPPPWDHLRDNLFPTRLYLNKLRESDFRKAFDDQRFEMIQWRRAPSPPEDEKLLTPEIERELAAKGYTRDELLTTGVTAYVRKRA